MLLELPVSSEGPAWRGKPGEEDDISGPYFICQSVFLLCPMCVCLCESSEGKNGCERGGKMQSSACLSGHTIQRREKPFIQHSLPTPPSKLPSNSLWPEWTRWHGSTALTSHRNTHTHTHTLFVLSSLLHSHSVHHPLSSKYLCSSSCFRTSFISFCMSSFTTLSLPYTMKIRVPLLRSYCIQINQSFYFAYAML